MTPRRLLRGPLAPVAGLFVIGFMTAATTAASGATLPSPHVGTYEPRIAGYQPRIVSYQPRVADDAPRPTAPSTVTVFSDVLFAFNSATLSPQAQSVLRQVVASLQTAPAGTVLVTGYTDSIGTPTYNLQLSQRRAAAVQQYLAAQVNRQDLTYRVVGMGEADPVAPNTNPDGSDNPSGRAQNRRVAIKTPS